MSTLDEITKEKQRISNALARVDAQREKLTDQLSELEATERVLARYSKGRQAKKTPYDRHIVKAGKPITISGLRAESKIVCTCVRDIRNLHREPYDARSH